MKNPLLLPGALIPIGIALVPTLSPHAGALLAGIAGCALLALLGRSWLAAGTACLLLGLLAGATRTQGPTLRGPGVALRGQVVAASGSRATLALEQVAGQPAQGPIQLRTGETTLRVGTQLAAFGRAGPSGGVTLPGAVSPAWTQAIKGQHSSLRVQDWLELSEGRARPNGEFPFTKHPGLLRALSSGDRSQVPEHEEALLRATGTRHLLAISGLHIGLLALAAASLSRFLLMPLSLLKRPGLAMPTRYLPALMGMAAALAFAWTVGSPLSAQRASIMVCGGLLGNASGRGMRPWNLLGGASAAVCLMEPGAPADLSFQLSFGAVMGLLTVSPRLERYLPPDIGPVLKWSARSLSASVGASLGTLPAVALHFQEISLIGPAANLVAVPLMGAVTVPAALLGSTGWMLPTALADGSIDWTLRWLTWLDQAPPWTTVHPAVGPIGALLLLGAVLLAKWPVSSLTLGLLALGLRERPLQTQVSFLAIGQGDAALIELPSGLTILVDAGPPGPSTLRWLRRRGITHIDELLVSHPHPDHYGGMVPILEQLTVGALRTVRPPIAGESDYAELYALALSQGVPILDAQAPVLDRRLFLLHPEPEFVEEHEDDPNEISLVLLLADRGHSVLFTGDIEHAGEDALRMQHPGPIDVLKVAHHGSKTSSDPALMQQLSPRLAVISCGVDNHFGHPHRQTLQTHSGWRVMRTDQHGTVQVRLGRELEVRSWSSEWTDWETVGKGVGPS